MTLGTRKRRNQSRNIQPSSAAAHLATHVAAMLIPVAMKAGL